MSTCSMALKMPSNYAIMNEEEMCYLEGGSYNVPRGKRYLSKNVCMSTASWLISAKKVSGMGQMQIAKEIFAHAYSYYNYTRVASDFGNKIATYCKSKAADGIAIMDNGDSFLRTSVYNLFWSKYPSNESYA